MESEINSKSNPLRGLWILAMVNSGIWAISIIALVFVMQHSPHVKGLFPILAGGIAVATSLINSISKLRKNG